MKKIATFLLFLLCHLNSFAQLGYWCKSEFITLTPDESQNYRFIQAMDTESQKILKDLSASKVTKDKSIRELNDYRFYVDKDYRLPKMDYYESTIYKSSEGETVVVLPRIVVSLIDGYHIENVLRRLDNSVKVESSERDRYILACQMRTSEEVLQAVQKLSGLEGIRYFEPEVFLKVTPCNTLYPYQYYLNNTSTGGVDINVVPAWEVTTGSSSVTIAVIDDGVESNHEDLSGRVLQGFTVDNSTGYGLPQNENDYNVKAHGTACAGIIAANNNTIGIRGIASSSNILPVNLFPYYEDDENFRCSNIEIANAIRWAYVRADILNIADVYPNSYDIYSAICDALTYGRGGKGCVIVAAAGNSGAFTSEVARPARYDGVIAVGAVLSDGTIWTWSQGGNCLDVVAPGGNFVGQGNIVTTDRTAPKGYVNYSNYTNTFGATSASCAEVSGIAALMLSVNSNLTTTQVRDALRSTATDLGATGFDTTYGYGLVNAAKAVLSVMSLNIIGASTIYDSESYYVDNLPLGFSVVWSLSDSFYNTYCLQQNTPYVNTCTIVRDNFFDMTNATLTASIMYNGSAVYSVTKNVSTQGSFLCSYNNGQINVSLIGNKSIFDGSATINSDKGLSAETVSWTLDVYSATTGEKEFSKEVTGSSYIIETTGWKPGIYVVKGLIGENVMSEKVVVR